jgi:hypothetical protein
VATVKLSGGKVILKGGKVSCSCCGCCLYAAATAVSADLPDAITLLGVGSLSKSGTDYGNTTNGVILESGVWARYVASVRTTSNCLISGNGGLVAGNDLVEDQFAATYNFSQLGYDDDETLTRTGLCVWEVFYHSIGYTEPYTPERLGAVASVRLIYNYDRDFRWILEVVRLELQERYDEETDEFIDILEAYSLDYDGKDDPQNRPDGEYSYLNVTIS